MTDNQSVTLPQVTALFGQLSGAYLSGLSDAYKQILEKASTEYATEASRAKAILDADKKALEDAASWARAYERGAVDNGDRAVGLIMDKWARIFEDKATEIAKPGKEALEKLSDLSTDIFKKLDQVSAYVPNFSEVARTKLGPAADAVGFIHGSYQWITTGEKKALADSAGGILGSAVGGWLVGAAAVAVAGFLGFTGAGLLMPLFFGAAVGAFAGSLLGGIWGDDVTNWLRDLIGDKLDPFWRLFDQGVKWVWPRDPLVLDLDGDGIELTSSSSSVLFDHNADGIRTGSQWVRPDDGMLVRDINGNGTIDSGRELFGDQTQIGTGVNALGQSTPLLARNGFEALRALDSNSDAFINSGDAAFNELRIWQDANQDGISQATELKSLDALGITQVSLGQVVETGTTTIGGTPTPIFTDQRGETTGQSSFTINGQEQTIRNINFQSNPFYRDFTDSIAITDTAKALPDMQGSGIVRDLREAMSLGDAQGSPTAQASALQAQVQAFNNAQTAQERQVLLDSLIAAWAHTSEQVVRGASGQQGDEILISNGYYWNTAVKEEKFGAQLDALGMDWRSITAQSYGVPNNQTSLLGMLQDAGLIQGRGAALSGGNTGVSALIVWTKNAAQVFYESSVTGRRIEVLERFNAQSGLDRFTAPGAVFNGTMRTFQVTLPLPVQKLFNQAYESLQDSVYQALYLQTAGKSYLDQIELVIDQSGLRLNFDALNQALADQRASNPAQAAVDLAEFVYFTRESLASSGWDGAAQLGELLEELARVTNATNSIAPRAVSMRARCSKGLRNQRKVARKPYACRTSKSNQALVGKSSGV